MVLLFIHFLPFLFCWLPILLDGRLTKICKCECAGIGRQASLRCLCSVERMGSSPIIRTNLYGGLAQLGEHLICIQKVIGSNPIFSTIIFSLSSMVEHAAVNRRVVGSSPTGRAIWRIGQVVKTRPFHGCNTSSNLVCVTINTAP